MHAPEELLPRAESYALEARGGGDCGVRVGLFRLGDRFAHTITVLCGSRSLPLMISREGTDADDWPASPPFQQVNLQTLDDGRQVAYLVGMAGSSHWSASIETRPEEAAVVFDVACRVKAAPGRLGSQYDPMASPRAASEGAGVDIEMAGLVGRVEVLGGDGPAAEIAASATNLAIRPMRAEPLVLPATIRWSFRISALPS